MFCTFFSAAFIGQPFWQTMIPFELLACFSGMSSVVWNFCADSGSPALGNWARWHWNLIIKLKQRIFFLPTYKMMKLKGTMCYLASYLKLIKKYLQSIYQLGLHSVHGFWACSRRHSRYSYIITTDQEVHLIGNSPMQGSTCLREEDLFYDPVILQPIAIAGTLTCIW